MNKIIDILMITHKRAQYTSLTLSRLLETCSENMRVWVWQNGEDQETINVVESFKNHPNFFEYYHSHDNLKLTAPTNWLWNNSNASFFSKVDDDCLVPYGWANTLLKAHVDIPKLGIISCWHFCEEDFIYEIAIKKIQSFSGNHKIMRNCWVGGSGYILKRECFDLLGPLKKEQSFTQYCIEIAKKKYIIGWYYPFLYQEHLDDPRSPHSLLKNNEDMQKWAPLSAKKNGVSTLNDWQKQLKRSAKFIQSAPYHPKYFCGWRKFIKRCKGKILRLFGIKKQW